MSLVLQSLPVVIISVVVLFDLCYVASALIPVNGSLCCPKTTWAAKIAKIAKSAKLY